MAAKSRGVSVPEYLRWIGLSHIEMGNESPTLPAKARDIILALRQAVTALRQIAARTSLMKRLTIIDAVAARNRLHDIERAILPLFVKHGD